MRPISTWHSPGRQSAPARRTARSRCVRSGCGSDRQVMPRGDDSDTRRAIEAVVRRSYGKLIAFLGARPRDIAGAEDALADAFATALTDWVEHGIPSTPEAWLLTVARRRMIDAARRRHTAAEGVPTLELIADEI